MNERHRTKRNMTTTSSSIISRLTGLYIIVKISTHTALGQEWMLPVNIKANPYHCMRISSNSGVWHTAWGNGYLSKKKQHPDLETDLSWPMFTSRSLHGTISTQTRSHPHAAYACNPFNGAWAVNARLQWRVSRGAHLFQCAHFIARSVSISL